LPKDIAKWDLVDMMKDFTWALGMRCESCHVGDPEKGFSSFDFASDDKPKKNTARIMMKMVNEINQSHLSLIDSKERQNAEVTCITCHRGQEVPRQLEDVILETARSRGIDSAVAKYKSLREKYYGSQSYDFTEAPLRKAAGYLLVDGNSDDAITLLSLNLEYHAESAMTLFTLGDTYAKAGAKEKAIEAFEKTLKLMPGNPALEHKIKQLKEPDK
jgi:tetratricopeptide (TPR) repeat protein